jgi:hypothetical protein
MKRLILALIAVSLFGCGGGGGANTATYKLSLQGTFAASSVGGIQFDLQLPAGVTIKTQADPATSAVAPSSSSFFLSGTAPSNAIMAASYASGTLHVGSITALSGFSAGEFATLVCDIPAGTTAPSPSAFVISNVRILDTSVSQNPIAGATVTIN